MFVISILVYPSLPDVIPMHWNIRGEVDNYMPKSSAIWFVPTMTMILWVLFQFLPLLDPKKDKYKLFQKEWDIIQATIIGFIAYLHGVVFYIALHPSVVIFPWIFIGLGALFVLMGNYLSKIRQNYFIGIKLPWTLADEDNWNKTHRFASWCFVIVGIITLVEAYVIWYAPVVIFGGIMLASLLPTIYSFLLYKNSAYKMKYVYAILLGLMFLVFTIRFISGEDDWICQNGEWVQHGHPSAPQPVTRCW